jgi:hypothetical protein
VLFVSTGGAVVEAGAYRKQAASEAELVFRGISPDALAGMSIAALGDVNRDGFSDFALGAPGANAVTIILGRRFQHGIMDLVPAAGLPTATTQTGIIRIRCDLPGDRFGWSVSRAGDFNHDGIQDIVIGWPGAYVMGVSDAGGAVVVFGSAQWSTTAPLVQILVSQLGPGKGFVMQGDNNDNAGVCVAGGGNLNGDLFDDIVIAAPGPRWSSGPVKFYVVYGQPNPPTPVNLGSTGLWGVRIVSRIQGVMDVNTSSTVCAWPGDVNRDGFDDLLLGTPQYPLGGRPGVGAAWLLQGRPFPPYSTLFLEDIGSSVAGTRIWPDPISATNAHVGWAVAGAGDINGDGAADFAVTAPDGKWIGQGGMVAVIYGRAAMPPLISLQNLTNGFWVVDDLNIPNDRFGASVAAAGDPNNDGVPDLIIGAPSSADVTARKMFAGHAYVLYCDRTASGVLPLTRPLINSLPDIGNTRGEQAAQTADRKFVNLVGVFGSVGSGQSGDLFGWSVCGPGDLNGDGVDDVLVGSPLSRTVFNTTAAFGAAFGFLFEPPRILAVSLDDPNGNRQANPGESLNVLVNMPVVVTTGPIANLFYVANAGVLGDSTLVQRIPGSNRFQIVLGRSALGIVVAGAQTAIDFNAAIVRNRVVSRELGVNPMDSGVRRVNDTAIDIRFPLASAAQLISPAAGGSVVVAPNADTRYDGHRIEFRPGWLTGAANVSVELRQIPDPPGDFGLGSAVWVTVSAPFTRALLTLKYRPEDVPPGLNERQMRIVYMAETTPGNFALRIVPGDQTVNTTSDTISVLLDSLPPSGAPSPIFRPFAGGSASGFAGLPIETVDERRQGMRPSAGLPVAPVEVALAPAAGKMATVTLTPGPYSLYTKHKLVFRDYATSAPGSVVVTIRTAALAERTYVNPVIGSQYFPDRSDAVFTIETRDASENPVAFATPVDVEVEFQTNNPHGYSDLMDFDGNPARSSQLRIVRSIQNPYSFVPNFVFIGGAQTVDATNLVVRRLNFANLTDAQGKATLGVVADPAVTGAGRWELYR